MKYYIQKLPDIKNIKSIFFVGIKGVGVCPLAIIAKEAGLGVAGSDIAERFITDNALEEKEIKVIEGFSEESVRDFCEKHENPIVITTGAHKGFDNPQVKWAKEKGIPILTQGQALALFMEGEILGREFEGISVAGSHGKTTISSLLATSLKASGLEPSYAVGTGEVFPLGLPGHLGHGQYFIAEADEYASEPVYDRVPKLLYQNPKYAILNNIDFDHPDLFKDIKEIEDAFLEFCHNVTSGGRIFMNGDDPVLSNFSDKIDKDVKVITYGSSNAHDFSVRKIVIHPHSSQFTVYKKDRELGVFEISIPGEHNVKNALSVIAFLTEIGFEARQIKEAIKVFTGTKRRTEIIGFTNNGSTVIDDYAHHPNEIVKTLLSLKGSYPGKKIVCVFQPHTFSRTKSMLGEFSKSFDTADHLLLLPVFKSMRDTEKDLLSVDEYRKGFENKKTNFFDTLEDVIEYIKKNFASNEYVIVTLGAGDVYKVAEKLVT